VSDGVTKILADEPILVAEISCHATKSFSREVASRLETWWTRRRLSTSHTFGRLTAQHGRKRETSGESKGVIGYIRTAAAIWYEVRSPAAVTDEPIDNRQNFPTWKKILLAVIHFLFLFFFLGKREIEEEVNQARALTYSTKKENCAVVNSLWGAWFVWIAFKAGSRPLLTAAWFSTTCFFIPFQAA
jgi:hypothetical protein